MTQDNTNTKRSMPCTLTANTPLSPSSNTLRRLWSLQLHQPPTPVAHSRVARPFTGDGAPLSTLSRRSAARACPGVRPTTSALSIRVLYAISEPRSSCSYPFDHLAATCSRRAAPLASHSSSPPADATDEAQACPSSPSGTYPLLACAWPPRQPTTDPLPSAACRLPPPARRALTPASPFRRGAWPRGWSARRSRARRSRARRSRASTCRRTSYQRPAPCAAAT